MKFMAKRSAPATIQSQTDYIHGITESVENAIFGLFTDQHQLVGTAGVQRIQPGGVPWMGILIGAPEYRGRGLGKILVWSIASIILQSVNVEAIRADMYKENVSSYKSFIAAGFRDCPLATTKPDVAVVECTRASIPSWQGLGIIEFHLTKNINTESI